MTCGLFNHADNLNIDENTKTMLDELHKRKLDISDTIFVIDVCGYIGSSTRSEIDYAISKGKKVVYYSNESSLSYLT